MRSLARSIRRPDKGGEPLPTVYHTFDQAGVFLRRGETTMLAGAPGSGKSSVGVDIAVKTKVPTLYFSADSTELTMASRLGSMLTRRELQEVEQMILQNPVWAGDMLGGVDHIRWVFDSAPTFGDIGSEVEAFEEVWGAAPQLIVIDNLTDVTDDDGGDEFSTLRSTMKGIKYLARESNAALLVLHHTSEASEGNPCPPRKAIHGKVSQMPAMILTLAAQSNGYMAVACVKNRQGPADPSGKTAMYLTFQPSIMLLADMEAR